MEVVTDWALAPKTPFVQIHKWRDALAKDQWTRILVRDAEKGPLEIEVVACPVQTKIKQRMMQYDEVLVIVRCLDENDVTKYDFYMSNAPSNTPLKEFARVAISAHRIEEAIKRGKSQAGLADYEVRNWRGWHHHQILSLMATWFLTQETQRGKKNHACNYGPADPRWDRDAVTSGLQLQHAHGDCKEQDSPFDTKRTRSILSLQKT